MDGPVPAWLTRAREIQALAQSGLTYCTNEFDIERYQRLREIAAEMVAAGSGLEAGAILADFTLQQGYATPKIDVRAGVIRDGKILLVQEKMDERWSMPGGWGDVGEIPSAMTAREAREESGFEVRVDKLAAVFDANRFGNPQLFHAYKLVFLCSISGGEARASNETLAVDFFDSESLPPLSEHRTNRAMIAEVFAHLVDPCRPTYFD